MKVQEHVTAGQQQISFLKTVFLMSVAQVDSLKRSVLVGNWFEIYEMAKNNFTRPLWINGWHREVQMSISYVCTAMYLLVKTCAL